MQAGGRGRGSGRENLKQSTHWHAVISPKFRAGHSVRREKESVLENHRLYHTMAAVSFLVWFWANF